GPSGPSQHRGSQEVGGVVFPPQLQLGAPKDGLFLSVLDINQFCTLEVSSVPYLILHAEKENLSRGFFPHGPGYRIVEIEDQEIPWALVEIDIPLGGDVV